MESRHWRQLLSNPLVLLFLIGMGAILVLRSLVPGLLGALFAAIAATLAVVAFAVLHVRRQSDLDVAGDETYYLGLLFTLVSLIIALVQLFVIRTETGLQLRTQELIGNFGVALVSTVAGILVRILLQSLSRTSHDFKDHESTSLQASTKRSIEVDVLVLRREVRQAADALSHFRRMTLRQAEEAKLYTESLIREFNENIGQTVRNEINATSATWIELSDRIREDHQRLAIQSDQLLSNLETRMSDATQKGVDDVVRVWQTSGTEFSKQLDALSSRFEIAATAAAHRTASTWDGVAASLQEGASVSRKRIEDHTSELASLLTSLTSMQDSLKLMVIAIDESIPRIESLADHAATASLGLADRAAEVVSAHKTMIGEIDHLRQSALKELQEKLSAERRYLEDEGVKWHSVTQNLVENGQVQLSATTENLQAAQRVNKQLAEHADRWSAAADQTNKSLVRVVEELTDIVRKS